MRMILPPCRIVRKAMDSEHKAVGEAPGTKQGLGQWLQSLLSSVPIYDNK